MFKRIKSILFIITMVMVFSVGAAHADDKDQQHASARPAPSARPAAHAAQNRAPVQTHREILQHTAYRAPQPIAQAHVSEPSYQQRQGPHVRGVQASAPVANNRLFHRQHHNNWQPRYNYYGNQYHFYPYVNIASMVELSGGYIVVGPDGQNYYYDQGTFYLQDQGGQYEAVAPPVGIIVNPIAANARQIVVNGQVFYRYKGVFYVQVAQGYQVVGPVQSDSDDS